MTITVNTPVREPARTAVDAGNLQLAGMVLLMLGGLCLLQGIAGSNPWFAASGIGWISVGLLITVSSLDGTRYLVANPLLFWAVSLLFGSALRPLYLLTQPEELRNWFMSGLPPELVVRGSILNGCFLVFAIVGYFASSSRVTTVTIDERYRIRRPVVGAILALSAAALAVYMQRLGITAGDLVGRLAAKRRVDVDGQAGSLGAVAWISATGLLASYLLLFFRQTPSIGVKPSWTAIGTLALFGLAIPILNGSRDGLIQPMLILLLIGTQFGRRIKWRQVGAIVVAAALLITTFGALRSAASNNIAVEEVFDGAVIAESLLGTHNWAGAEKTAVVEARVPEFLPFQNGSTYIAAVVAPIPRELWSGKPAVRIGPEVGERLFALDRDGRTGLPPGAPGELFINFGYLGLPLGGLVFGAVQKWVFDAFRRARETDSIRVVYVVVIVNLGLKLPGGDFAGVFTEILMSSLVLTGLARALRWRES